MSASAVAVEDGLAAGLAWVCSERTAARSEDTRGEDVSGGAGDGGGERGRTAREHADCWSVCCCAYSGVHKRASSEGIRSPPEAER